MSCCCNAVVFITSLQADTLIAPFSESAALMLRELLIRLTMHDNGHETTVSTHIADSSESTSTCNVLQELKFKSELQEQFGLGSRITTSVSSDCLSTSSDLGHSLRKGKVRCKAIKHTWRNNDWKYIFNLYCRPLNNYVLSSINRRYIKWFSWLHLASILTNILFYN